MAQAVDPDKGNSFSLADVPHGVIDRVGVHEEYSALSVLRRVCLQLLQNMAAMI